MSPEIYEAMKRRITKITHECEDYRSIIEEYRTMDLSVVWGVPFYDFGAEGLNQGLSEFDDDYVDSFIQPISTNNLWNVCQRFYSFIKNYKNIDQRLLAL